MQTTARARQKGRQQISKPADDDGTLGWLLKEHGLELLFRHIAVGRDYRISGWPLTCKRETGAVTGNVLKQAHTALTEENAQTRPPKFYHVPVFLSQPKRSIMGRKEARLHFNVGYLRSLDSKSGCVCFPM